MPERSDGNAIDPPAKPAGAGDADATATVNERSDPDRPDADAAVAPAPARAALADGASETRYRRGAELGRGGMGRVVEATDRVLGRTVAVKEIRGADAELAHRFEREVYVTARLEHPAIVPVYDAGRTADGLPFYVMRRVTGRPLDAVIGEATGLDERLALIPNVLAAVDAIAHAHNRGVIHRDLKPGNVLVGDHGETLVIDWGLAKLVDERDPTIDPGAAARTAPVGGTLDDALRTRIGSVIGTPGFMPPEQALGTDVDVRGDVYALGATLYHLLAGVPPWSGTEPTAILDKVVVEAPPPVSELVAGVPPDLAAIVDKAMARDRTSRYADAGALGDDLRRFLRGQLVAAHRYSSRQRLARWVRRNRAALAVGTAALIALIAVGVLSLSRILDDRDRIAHSERQTRAALAQAEDQNDRLLLETARAAVDVDPTYAIARLAELPARSTRWAEARAIASAARARGITVGYTSAPRTPWATVMSTDGGRVAVSSGGHEVVIHDLAARRTSIARSTAEIASIAWVGPTRLAVAGDTAITFHEAGPAAAVPPPPLTSPVAISQLFASVTGALAWRTTDDRVFVDDAGTTELAFPPGTADWIQFSDDGTLIAGGGKLGVRVFRRAGAAWGEVLRRDGHVGSLAIAQDSTRVAIMTETEIREWVVDGDALVARGPWPSTGVGQLDYAGDHLLASWPRKPALVDLHGDQPETVLAQIDSFPLTLAGIGPGEIAVARSDRLVLATSSRQLSIPLREFGLHVVARPGAPWVVVTGHAYVVAIDLREVWPEALDLQATGGMIGVAPNSVVVDAITFARVLDVPARTHADLATLPMPRGFDAEDRAVFSRDGDDKRMIQVIRLDGGDRISFPDAEATAITIAGGELVTGTATGDVVGRPLAGGPAHTLAHLPAAILGVHDRGPWLIAVAADGSVWRRGPAGEATAKVDTAPVSATVAADGMVYIAIGRDVLGWPAGAAAPAPFAHAEVDLTGFAVPGARAVAIIGDDYAVYRIDRADGSIDQSLPTSRWGFGISVDGTTATRIDDQGLLRIADLDAGVGWTLPTEAFNLTDAEPSPDGLVIFAAGGGNGVLRYANDLPRDPAALRAWITTRTNARAGVQFGAVEWQLPEPTPVR